MTHESDILPRRFRAQPWTKFIICFLKNWFSLNLFESAVENSIRVQAPWSPPHASSKHCPLLSTSAEWSRPHRLWFLFIALQRLLHVWFNWLRCRRIRIRFSRGGCVSCLFDSCRERESLCAIDWAGRADAADSQLNKEHLISNWFLFEEQLPKALVRRFVRWNKMLLILFDLAIGFFTNLAPRLKSDVKHILTLNWI